MIKSKVFFGIDISKKVFDVMSKEGNHFQFDNNLIGFKKFLRLLDSNSHCVMESTGSYHIQLAYFLKENNVLVSVENPISIKRFIQMKLSKIKTDKSDAKMICLYAQNVELKLWEGNSKIEIECFQITRLVGLYTKQCTALKNKLQSEEALGFPCKSVITSLKRNLKQVKKEIEDLELQLTKIVKEEHAELMTKLESIPGIGRKTGIQLIVLTSGFKKFNSASELCSYAGLTPVIRTSGSSVRGRSRISKMGNRNLRSLLFMCSFSAYKCNKPCKALFDRIVAKGKSKKLALIAVSNKLLKQAYAIANSDLIFDENYKSKLIKN